MNFLSTVHFVCLRRWWGNLTSISGHVLFKPITLYSIFIIFYYLCIKSTVEPRRNLKDEGFAPMFGGLILQTRSISASQGSLLCVFKEWGWRIKQMGFGGEPVSPRTVVLATVRHSLSAPAKAQLGSEQRCRGTFWWCRLYGILLCKQVSLTLMWMWMQDRPGCRRSAGLVPLRKVSIDP